MPDKPTCLAIIVCDLAIQDAATGKQNLIGVFSILLVPQVPHAINAAVLVSVTGLTSKHSLTFNVKTPSDKTLFSQTMPSNTNDPLAVMDLLMNLNGMPIEEEGIYFIDVLCGSDHLGSRRIQVVVPNKHA